MPTHSLAEIRSLFNEGEGEVTVLLVNALIHENQNRIDYINKEQLLKIAITITVRTFLILKDYRVS